jgi:hypothetical protein
VARIPGLGQRAVIAAVVAMVLTGLRPGRGADRCALGHVTGHAAHTGPSV